MNKKPVQTDENRPMRDIIRMIFNLSIGAVLIHKNKKLIGIITEEDILHRLFPSIKEFMENYHSMLGEGFMEEKLSEIIDRPVREFMTKEVISAKQDTSIMKAQSKMLLNGFTHLPVVDDDNAIIGIISQGDVFRTLVSDEVSHDDQDEFHDWLAQYDDLFATPLRDRTKEADDLDEIFERVGDIKSIADVQCGPGRHLIALSNYDYAMTGFENSSGMYGIAKKNLSVIDSKLQNKIKLVKGDYSQALLSVKNPFDGIIFMGNALPRIFSHDSKILNNASSAIRKRGVLVLQMLNFGKILNDQGHFVSFNTVKSTLDPDKEYAFFEFYDPPRSGQEHLLLTLVILFHNGKRWIQKSINSTEVAPLGKNHLSKILKSCGFSNITFYGSYYKEPLFQHLFDEKKHDWMNIVAVK